MIGITKTSTIQYQISFIQSIDMSVTAIEDSSNTIELSTLDLRIIKINEVRT